MVVVIVMVHWILPFALVVVVFPGAENGMSFG